MKKILLNNFLLLNAFTKPLCTALYRTLGHVLIGGGTGFIGNSLRELLIRENYAVTVISRVNTGEQHIITWADLVRCGIPNNICAVVNLTGAPIMIPFKKFGNRYKKHVWTSRIGSTMLLADIINCSKHKPDVFIAVTSTNIYPPNGIHTENYHPTDEMNCNFFTRLGCDWEKAMQCIPFGVRQISIRTGTVLGHGGGFLKWLNYSTTLGQGTIIGNGCQYQPWIHMSDLLYLIIHSIENKHVNGTLNGVSPQRITNGELTTMYTQILRRPVKLKNSESLLKIIFGKERTTLLLEGRQVLPTKTVDSGFQFQYCEIQDALKHLLVY